MIPAIPTVSWWRIGILLAAFAAGWVVHGWKCEAGKTGQLEAQIEDIGAQDTNNATISMKAEQEREKHRRTAAAAEKEPLP
jgi:hypothetical protein